MAVFVSEVNTRIRRLKIKSEKRIEWHALLSDNGPSLLRTELPNGWLVYTEEGLIEFVPDPEKRWVASVELQSR